jgi:hypothetical protein
MRTSGAMKVAALSGSGRMDASRKASTMRAAAVSSEERSVSGIAADMTAPFR